MRKRHTSTGFPSVVKRKNGKKVVIWRWYEKGQDGKSRERWKTLGLASRFKSDAAAQQEAERLGLGRPIEEGPRTLKELVDHWLDTECPATDEDPNERRAFSTRDNYRGYLRKWVKPRWGDQALDEVKAVAVESWLSTLKKDDGTALADGSKKKIRDRPTREGRNLIERALEAAVSRIADDTAVEEAVREGLTLDKDTKGVPGSPPLFETILKKIERASVFVPDLTFVGTRSNGEPTPNPNVLIEYGWALRHLGHHRIVAVMNEAHGSPKSLPFDLAHHRFPIAYNLPDDATESVRQAERLKLAKVLENGIRAVFDSSDFKASVAKKLDPHLFKPKEPMNGRARFRPQKERIGVYVDPVSAIIGSREPTSVHLSETAAMWLRVMPVIDPGRKWLPQDLKEQALLLASVPLIPSAGDIHFVRDSDGCGYFRIYDEKLPSPAVSYIFDTGEIWVINAWPSAMSPYSLMLF